MAGTRARAEHARHQARAARVGAQELAGRLLGQRDALTRRYAYQETVAGWPAGLPRHASVQAARTASGENRPRPA